MSKRAEEKALEKYPVNICGYQCGCEVGDSPEPLDYNEYERKACQEGYEQAEKDLGWHSVDESLPPVDEEVIVLTDELNIAPVYKIAFGHIVDRRYAMDYDGWNIPGVKYWMPIPKLPNEREK